MLGLASDLLKASFRTTNCIRLQKVVTNRTRTLRPDALTPTTSSPLREDDLSSL